MGEVGNKQAFFRSKYFKSKPRQVLIFCVLPLVLFSVVYSPALKSSAGSVIRSHAVEAGGVEVVVPRGWSSLADSSVVAAYTPCLTVFCSGIRSSMEIRTIAALQGYEEGWMSRAESVFAERRLATLGTRTLESGAGVMRCIGAKDGAVILWACMANDSGVVATFKGSPSDLNDFYRMLGSTKVLGRR
jgi:hypothetical protein